MRRHKTYRRWSPVELRDLIFNIEDDIPLALFAKDSLRTVASVRNKVSRIKKQLAKTVTVQGILSAATKEGTSIESIVYGSL